VCIKRLAPRIQSSIEKWAIVGKPWVDGHPAGITQTFVYGDDIKADAKFTIREIPWDKLLIFTNRKRGNNYEGESILRRSYSPYFYLDLIQKIAGISVERYGVGLPYAKIKGGNGASDNTKLEELLMNIRSNEQGYALINENVMEFKILTPEGSGAQNTLLENLLLFYDRKLYESVLAGFLNLGASGGGSNALSKDQSAFFMKSLKSYTKYIEGVLSKLGAHLIELNYGKQDGYPVMRYADVGDSDATIAIASMVQAKNSGLVTWCKDDEVTVRSQLGLPEIQDSVLEMYENQEEMRIQGEQEEEGVTEEALETKKIPAEKEPEDLEDPEDSTEEKEETMSQLSEATHATLAQREKEFVKNISDYENYLESEYSNIHIKVKKTEDAIKNKLLSIYSKVDTELKDGMQTITKSSKNTILKREAIAYITDQTKILEKELLGSTIQTRLFEKSQLMAFKTIKSDRVFFSSSRIDSIISGYKSNVEALLYNEPRRMIENVTLVFGSLVAVNEAKKQAEETQFNENILKLSTLSHPRQAFNAIVNDQALADGFTFFKGLVPKSKLKELSPEGMTKELLYKIYTESQLTEIVNTLATKTNVSPLFGLNIHHGGYMYFLPIASALLLIEQERAKNQREELQKKLDDAKGLDVE